MKIKYVHRKEIIEFFKNKGHKIFTIEPYGVDKDQNYFSHFIRKQKQMNILIYLKTNNCVRVEVWNEVLNHLFVP